MYISIRKYKTNNADEVARLVKEQFLEKVGKIAGFRGLYVINTGEGSIASINFFETKEGAEESNKVGPTWAKEAAADLLSLTEITTGEVIVEKELALV